jgi:arylsulfatase A-like enzyme
VTYAPGGLTPRRIFACAVWIGLIYGLFEGAAYSVLRLLPWLASPLNGTTLDILWLDPLEYAVIFGGVGLVFAAASRLKPTSRWDVGLVAMLTGVAAYAFADLQDQHLANYATAALGCGVGLQAARWYRRQPDRWMHVMVATLPHVAALVALLAAVIIGGGHALESAALHRSTAADETHPNVLLLVIDTERADHLSSYGYERRTTPNLDRLASEGVLFEHAHSPSSWTLPSHASIMTGQAPHDHHAGDPMRPFLDRRYPTLAEALRDAGYMTGGFVANTFWAGRQEGIDRGFIRYEDHMSTFNDAVFKPVLARKFAWELAPKFGWTKLAARPRAEDVNRHLLDWLDHIGKHPFFAFVNYMDVHTPYHVPEPYLTMFSTHNATAGSVELAPTSDLAAERLRSRIRDLIDGYDGSLVYLDQQIDALLAALKQRGLASNTLVIVTADHGESFGEHDFVSHGNSVYLVQTHVPLIMRFPGHLPAGIRDSRALSLTRLADTILALTNQHHPGFTGAPFMTRGGSPIASPEPTVLTEVARRRSVPKAWPTSRGWMRALIDDRWQFLLTEDGHKELYDLTADPNESNDRAGDHAMSSIVARFEQELDRMMNSEPGDRGAMAIRK